MGHTVVGANLEPQDIEITGSVVTVAVSTTIALDGADKTYLIGTDALVITLPLIGNDTFPIGSKLRFVNIGADGNNTITLAPNALDAFIGTIANAAADSVSGGVVDKDIVNTKATANKGDYIQVEAFADTEWYITGGVGIWASEA